MIRTVVVKVGTSSLTGADGRLDRGFVDDLARQISAEMDAGRQVVLVTSGAIRAGAERMGWKTRPRTVPMKQAAAAVGQGLLMETYAAAFGRCGRAVGQMLLTRHDTADRSRYVNARNTLQALLRSRVVPIVNESDTVAGREFGTRVPPKERPLRGRKRWIAFGGPARGAIRVNACARAALVRDGVSLLPVGIIGVEGRFAAGDTVSLVDEACVEFGRGV